MALGPGFWPGHSAEESLAGRSAGRFPGAAWCGFSQVRGRVLAGLGWTRRPEGVLEVMGVGVEASKTANSRSPAACAASFYGQTTLNVPDLV